MKGTNAEKRVYAKTGSITGTYTLAGYLYRKDRHLLIFAILNDGVPYGEGNNIRKMQDQILHILAAAPKAR